MSIYKWVNKRLRSESAGGAAPLPYADFPLPFRCLTLFYSALRFLTLLEVPRPAIGIAIAELLWPKSLAGLKKSSKLICFLSWIARNGCLVATIKWVAIFKIKIQYHFKRRPLTRRVRTAFSLLATFFYYHRDSPVLPLSLLSHSSFSLLFSFLFSLLLLSPLLPANSSKKKQTASSSPNSKLHTQYSKCILTR